MKLVAEWNSGKMDKESALSLNKHFAKMKDGEYVIEVKRYYKNRSIPQNKLLWDIYRQASEQTGYETDELHAMMGQKFLLDETRKTPFVISTTKLTTQEFSNFISRIVRFFTVEAGLIIYLPEDYESN
ncbi:MAG: hypothetical protein GY750_20915 [Lentisphaerae bacterium]|nr:hypothetical protein [Lentisphaerota bacterium]